jgi:hypothetical protein
MEYLVFGLNIGSEGPRCSGVYMPGDGCKCYNGTFNEVGLNTENDIVTDNLHLWLMLQRLGFWHLWWFRSL